LKERHSRAQRQRKYQRSELKASRPQAVVRWGKAVEQWKQVVPEHLVAAQAAVSR
jgi:hypothetical protein